MLGFRCDLHRTAISKLERGESEPLMGTIVKLAEVLETSPEALLQGIHWQEKQQRFKIDRPPRRR